MHNVQNAMFAAAMAFSMGLKLEDIRHGLRTFDTTFFQAPGRMNIFDEHPFKVILDYGHNPAAVEAMCQLVERLGAGGPADLRAAGAGRPARRGHPRTSADRGGAVRPLHPAGATTASAAGSRRRCRTCCATRCSPRGVPAEQILMIPDEQTATDAALREAQPGDLLLLFADAITRSWKQVIQFQPEAPAQAGGAGLRASRPEPAAVTASLVDDGAREFVRDNRAESGCAREDGTIDLTFHESRRLTGPGRWCSTGPGAALEIHPRRRRTSTAPSTAGGTRRAGDARRGRLGRTSSSRVRAFTGGASLALTAPLDALYAATDAQRGGLGRGDGRRSTANFPSATPIRRRRASHRGRAAPRHRGPARRRPGARPHLPRRRRSGVGRLRAPASCVWPASDVPAPARVDWARVHDVPVALVTGSNGKTTVVRLLAAMLAAAGRTVGLTSTDGVLRRRDHARRAATTRDRAAPGCCFASRRWRPRCSRPRGAGCSGGGSRWSARRWRS